MAAAINTYTSAVIYRVTLKKTGRVFYAMPTGLADGSCYQITKEAGKYSCTCPDCQYRKRDCKHILALIDHLQAKAALKAASAPAPAPKAQPSPVLSPARAAMTLAERRDTALLYTDDAPFSIFKTERRYQTPEDECAARDGAPSSDHYSHAYR
jgi:hypothetical protein